MKTMVALMAMALVAGASAWAPVPCPGSGSKMMTSWGEKVTPENAWRSYPRPQMVRSQWTNLNGLWEYAITSNAVYTSVSPWDKYETCGEVVQKGEILVPFAVETPLSGVGRLLNPDELLWYRRMLDVKKVPGTRLILNFGAVDFRCQVFIGHNEVTDIPHEGGLVPFSVDVTDYVRDGANELIICVWDPTSRSLGACGKQVFNPAGCNYTRMSGIWQTVWTETVPESRIDSYRVVTDIDTGTVDIRFVLAGSKTKDDVVVVVDGVGTFKGQDRVTIKMPAGFRLWSPETPNLYNFTAKYGSDEVRGYFGMRKFEKRADANGVLRFYLNNEPYFILGPLDQGWWPDGFLTPPSEEAMAFDIQTLKDMGCNMMRKHMKDEPARYYHLCDTMGLLVVQDMAAGGGDRNLRYGFYRREFKEMVDYLYNFPSIVMWVPFNENWGCQPGEFFTHNTLDWIRRYDPTRLVDGPSGWDDYEGGDFRRYANGKSTVIRGGSGHKPFPQCEAADAVDMHYYRGPSMHPVNPRRVSFLGEYGGLGQKVPGHMWVDNGKSWGYGGTSDTSTKEGLTKVYLGLMDNLVTLAFKGLGGAVYTQTSDVELEINGYLTYDRKVLKYDAAKLAAAHRKVLEMAKLGAVYKSVTKPVFPKHDPDLKAWAYTTTEPSANWMNADFDDSTWMRSAGGFGDQSISVHAQAKVMTPWTTKTLWVRRHFTCQKDEKIFAATFDMFHDEDVTIYLNGVEILHRTGYNQSYEPFTIQGDVFAAALREGDNVLAVKVVQTAGGQYFDTGLSVERLEK